MKEIQAAGDAALNGTSKGGNSSNTGNGNVGDKGGGNSRRLSQREVADMEEVRFQEAHLLRRLRGFQKIANVFYENLETPTEEIDGGAHGAGSSVPDEVVDGDES